MAQVTITLNNRTYRLACNDGEEKRLQSLAQDVKSRVEKLAREFGQPADERLLLMAAVLLADELWDLREAHDAMLSAAAEVLREAAQGPEPSVASAPQPKAATPSPTQTPSPSQSPSPAHRNAGSQPAPKLDGKGDGRVDRPIAGGPQASNHPNKGKSSAA